MHLRRAALSFLLVVLSAYGGAPAATGPLPSVGAPVPNTSAAPTASGAASGGRVDLTGVDVCSFLDETGVQEITGAAVPFETQGKGPTCFWAVPRPGVPQYVEVRVSAHAGGLSGYNFNPGAGCTIAAVTGIGSEAKGATCPPNPQRKIHLVAWDRGVLLTVLVNEPARPLEPADLGAIANRVLQQLASR